MKATTNQFLKDKLTQYQNGQLSPAEREIIDKWFDTNLLAAENEAYGEDPDGKQRYHDLLTPLKQAIALEKTKRNRRSYAWLKIACSIILITAISLFIINKMKDDPISHFASFQTYHTEKGKMTTITLQDGTKIWMNAGTTIRVPSNFNSLKFRKIFLDTGEAFFDVKHDPSRPFSIATDSMVTTVLGTTFNIKAYPESDLYQVAVASGKVRVAQQNGDQTTVLSEGLIKDQVLTQQLDAGTTSVSKQDATLISGWKTSRSIYINDLTLSQIGEELSRHYAIDVIVNATANQTYSIHLQHQDLKLVLQQLAMATGINYQLTKSQLTLNPAPK